MKKTLIVMLALVTALALLWHLYPEVLRPWLARVPLESPLSSSKPVYQWRDASGAWQVTDRPPPEGTPFEVKRYDLDANILPVRPAGEGD